MTFGEQNTEKEAHEILSYAFENGINTLDTAEIVRHNHSYYFTFSVFNMHLNLRFSVYCYLITTNCLQKNWMFISDLIISLEYDIKFFKNLVLIYAYES